MKKIRVTLKNPNDVDLVLCRDIGNIRDNFLSKYRNDGHFILNCHIKRLTKTGIKLFSLRKRLLKVDLSGP